MKKLILSAIAVLIIQISYAQTSAPGEVMVAMELAYPDSLTNADLGIDPNDPEEEITLPADYRVRINTEVLDSTGLRKVHLKLGSTQGGGEFFHQIIDLDDDVLWPEGFFYRWREMTLSLNLGIIQQMLNYYAEIKFEDNVGGVSIPVEVSNVE